MRSDWNWPTNEPTDRPIDWSVWSTACHIDTPTHRPFHETIDDYANIIRHLEFDVNKMRKKQKRNDFFSVFDLIWSASASANVPSHTCAERRNFVAHWHIVRLPSAELIYYVYKYNKSNASTHTGMKNNNAKYVYGSQRSLLFHALADSYTRLCFASK